jgi:hypothetical protein
MDYKEKIQGISNDLQNNWTGLHNRQLKSKLNWPLSLLEMYMNLIYT